MSVCRPARCLLSRTTSAALPKTSAPRRPFHSTPCQQARRRPHYPNVKASDMGLLNEHVSKKYPAFGEADETALRAKYSDKQLEAIRLAEQAVDARDLELQNIPRQDRWGMPYEDDLSTIDPVLDHKVKKPMPYGLNLNKDRKMGELEEKWAEQMLRLGEKYVGEDENHTGQLTQQQEEEMALEAMKFFDDPDTVLGGNNERVLHALRNIEQYDSYVQELPKIQSADVKAMIDRGEEEEDPHMVRLAKYMGWSEDTIKRVRTKILVEHFVVNQTRMGKIRSMYYLCIAGNGNGLLGVGEGKATEPEDARKQATLAAIKNMKPIPRYENRTIYGEVSGKVGAVELTLSSRPPGFGVRTQHLIFEMARAAGITDLSARVTRSRNKMNVVKAAWEALMSQRLPEDIARARGRKLVDVRKVYYGASIN